MKVKISMLAAAAMCLAVACKEEQVLYSYEAEEEQAARPAPQAPMMATPTTEVEPAPSLRPPEDRATLAEDVETVRAEMVGIAFDLPASWEATEPSSAMRKAQYALPPAEAGGRGGEMVVFHFGPNQGGGAMANIQRWIGQMDVDAGTEPTIYIHDVGDMKISEVVVFGTQLPSTMGTGPTEPLPGSGLHGVIIEGAPQGSVFIKITGDRATVEAAEPAVATMLETLEAMG